MDTHDLIHKISKWCAHCTHTHPIYLVGGAVRDTLLGHEVLDLDLVTEEAYTLAMKIVSQTPATLVPFEKKGPSYRLVSKDNPQDFIDISEQQGHPIQIDLARRDFTMNAIAYQYYSSFPHFQVIDPFGGMNDIKEKRIKIVSEKNIGMDSIRILRGFRFAAQYKFSIDRHTKEIFKKFAHLLQHCPGERISKELITLLKYDHSAATISQMYKCGVLEQIFPEIVPLAHTTQNYYHQKAVWAHSLLALKYLEHIMTRVKTFFGDEPTILENIAKIIQPKLPYIKLATLFHDIGKPATMGIKENGRITFYNHHKIGAEMMEHICQYLRMGTSEKDFMSLLVREHMRIFNLSKPHTRTSTMLRWFNKLGDAVVPVILIGMADVTATRGQHISREYVNQFYEWGITTIKNYFKQRDEGAKTKSFLDGYDLIESGIKPGKIYKRILQKAQYLQNEGLIKSREEALAWLSKYVEKSS